MDLYKTNRLILLILIFFLCLFTIILSFIYYPKKRLVSVLESWNRIAYTPIYTKSSGSVSEVPGIVLKAKTVDIAINSGELAEIGDEMLGGFNLTFNRSSTDNGEFIVFECLSKRIFSLSGNCDYENVKSLTKELKPVYSSKKFKNLKLETRFVWDNDEITEITERDISGRPLEAITTIRPKEIVIVGSCRTCGSIEMLLPDSDIDYFQVYFNLNHKSKLPEQVSIERDKSTKQGNEDVPKKESTLKIIVHSDNSMQLPQMTFNPASFIALIPFHSQTAIFQDDRMEYTKRHKDKHIIILASELSMSVYPLLSRFPARITIDTNDKQFSVTSSVSDVSMSGIKGRIKYGLDTYQIDELDEVVIKGGEFLLKSESYPNLIIEGETNDLSINESKISVSYWNMLDNSIKAAIIGAIAFSVLGWIGNVLRKTKLFSRLLK